jgi:hypothetical protein
MDKKIVDYTKVLLAGYKCKDCQAEKYCQLSSKKDGPCFHLYHKAVPISEYRLKRIFNDSQRVIDILEAF